MSMENSSSITWQKIATIAAVLMVIIPTTAPILWHILFPPNYLLYEVTPTIETEDFLAASVIVVNAGTEQQKDTNIYFPSRYINPNSTLVEISSPRRSNLRTLFEAKPKISLTKYTYDSGFRLPIGTINPEEEVRVTLLAIKSKDEYVSFSFSSELKVDSSSSIAIEADGYRRPAYANNLHDFYWELAPFLLAMMLGILVVVILAGMTYGVFFDSPEKRMTRLWRQMDLLQEYIDKERRYK